MRKLVLQHLPCSAMGCTELSDLLSRLRWLHSLSMSMSPPLGDDVGRSTVPAASSPGGIGDSADDIVNAEPVPTLKDLQDSAELEDQGYAVDALLAAARGGTAGKALAGTVQAVAGQDRSSRLCRQTLI